MNTASDSPPPVLDYARVLSYAVVDSSIQYIERQTLYVGRKLLGPVSHLLSARASLAAYPKLLDVPNCLY